MSTSSILQAIASGQTRKPLLLMCASTAMQELCARMRKQGAASVSVVALLDKVARRVVDLKPDYTGFEVCCFIRHTFLCAQHNLPHATCLTKHTAVS